MATTDSDGFTVEVSFEVNTRMSDDLREERNPNSAPTPKQGSAKPKLGKKKFSANFHQANIVCRTEKHPFRTNPVTELSRKK